VHLSPENDDRQMKRRIRQIVIGAAILLGAVLLFGAYSRYVEASDVRDWTHESQIPTVSLISPKAGDAGQPLVLPGTLSAFYDAKIYAQVSGYVKSWNRDIGAHVKKGEILAVIDTPELDQQITQARADLSAAVAAQKLSAVTASRWRDLLRQDAVARQDVDVKEADLAAKSEALKSAQANLDRLLATKQFAQIVAPFDGVVTARNTDVGALINVGSGAPGTELFVVSDTRKLRVYVSVPQSYAAAIHAGGKARLSVPEQPGKSYAATVQTTSRAISASSGGMLVQLTVDNTSGELLPGGSAQLSLDLPATAGTLAIPPGALIFNKSGLTVATVGDGDKVVLKPVTVARDLGSSVEVATGLSAGDRVIENPPDGVANGDLVRVSAAGGKGG